MFDGFFKRVRAFACHRDAPFAEERGGVMNLDLIL